MKKLIPSAGLRFSSIAFPNKNNQNKRKIYHSECGTQMKPPELFKTSFNCPYCSAFAKQEWFWAACSPIMQRFVIEHGDSWRCEAANSPPPSVGDVLSGGGTRRIQCIDFSKCSHCENISVWHGDELVLPKTQIAPTANPDMPEDVTVDYNEATSILVASPRGAAALLRLALQKLCKHLGEPGKHIDTDIKSLVAKGLDVRVQQALDSLRVIGNEAVHPGTLDLKDDRRTATTLFHLLNLVVDKMISEPKHVQSVYDMLPESKRKGIEKRDT